LTRDRGNPTWLDASQYDDWSMSYWTDIFTLETWAQAEVRGFRVTGFPPPTPGKGGYSIGMFERVRPGDVFLCYCKSPARRWVGALRVQGEVFESDEPVWGLTDAGDARYPWRYVVEPVVTLDPARGIPGAKIAAELDFLRRLKQWGTYLQRSLNRVPDRDGERLLAMLREPREPVPIEIPRRHPRPREAAALEPTLLDAQALSLKPQSGQVQTEEALTEPRTHTEIQVKLRDIGLFEGFDVWVADRGTLWNERPLGEECLTDLPVVAADRTRSVMRVIDVIWFRKGPGHPVRFFEIEHSTSVYSGLLRFNDVMIDFPIPEAFVVGDGEKTLAKFEREIARRTFEHSGLRKVTRFLFDDLVRQTWRQYQEVGAGSRVWAL
jgi:hypothetical protein